MEDSYTSLGNSKKKPMNDRLNSLLEKSQVRFASPQRMLQGVNSQQVEQAEELEQKLREVSYLMEQVGDTKEDSNGNKLSQHAS